MFGQREPSSSPRPSSPLRNGFVPPFADPIDSDEDEDWGPERYRSTSPATSVTQFATNLANRVNSLLTPPTRQTSGMLTDAQLEAQAERERDQSRREAERILTREANERRATEERLLALMQNTKGSSGHATRNDLQPPPTRSQTMSNQDPPSPATSQKEGSSWWTTAKNKLTPTKEKEPLTPAQQVIQETKAREKEIKKNGKGKDKEWAAYVEGKHNDSHALNLNVPPGPTRKPVPISPSSPTPFRPNVPQDLSPSPLRPGESRQDASSPSRETPPLYAQFNSQGTLDVHSTLLVIAKRFEKLEKWTVGHVRALEERMGDVERWLVDKEKEKEKASLSTLDLSERKECANTQPGAEIHELRDEITELQGRVGELGREVAKLTTAPANLSSAPSRSPAITPASITPMSSSSADFGSLSAAQSNPRATAAGTPRRVPSFTPRNSTSPPLATSGSTNARSYSRLPYPSGDYATPPDSGVLDRGTFVSPASSPDPLSSFTTTRPLNIPGVPKTASSISSSVSSYGSIPSSLPRKTSMSPSSNDMQPPKKPVVERPTSVSPTPRKRYTVALGRSITDRPEKDNSRSHSSIGTLSSSITLGSFDDNTSDDESKDYTIGKSASRLLTSNSTPMLTPANSSRSKMHQGVSSSDRRLRTQSAYLSPSPSTLSNGLGYSSPSPATSLNRLRSKSIERFGLGISSSGSRSSVHETGGIFSGGKFVDPLVLRKQEKDGLSGKGKVASGDGKKVPVGQLVAFFDGEGKR